MRFSASISRFPLLLLLAGWVGTVTLHAEMTDEQKKALFKKSHSSSDSPSHHADSKRPKKHSPGTSSSHAPSKKKKHHASSSDAHPSSSPKAVSDAPPHSGASEQASVSPQTSRAVAPGNPPAPAASAASAAVVPGASSAISLPHGATPSAPITIEKSGIEQAQGLEPAPPSSPGFFGWLFGNGGSHRSYSYLSAATRAAIDRAPVRRGRWKYIIVHNSGTREGNARVFDIYHFRVRHMQNGLAYHFVIGDGHGSGDGQVEIGHRWTAQLNGGHVASDYLNDISLGICLVGDFNRDLPTKAQMGALEELIAYLRSRVGKTQGRQAIIYAHKEINPRPTDCPGERFPYGWLHAKFH